MSDQPQKTPLVELLRAVPEDLRAEWPSQWDERGNPTGHTLSPVGKHCHEAADEITSLKAQRDALLEVVDAALLYGLIPYSSVRAGSAPTHSVAAQIADRARDAVAKVRGGEG